MFLVQRVFSTRGRFTLTFYALDNLKLTSKHGKVLNNWELREASNKSLANWPSVSFKAKKQPRIGKKYLPHFSRKQQNPIHSYPRSFTFWPSLELLRNSSAVEQQSDQVESLIRRNFKFGPYFSFRSVDNDTDGDGNADVDDNDDVDGVSSDTCCLNFTFLTFKLSLKSQT